MPCRGSAFSTLHVRSRSRSAANHARSNGHLRRSRGTVANFQPSADSLRRKRPDQEPIESSLSLAATSLERQSLEKTGQRTVTGRASHKGGRDSLNALPLFLVFRRSFLRPGDLEPSPDILQNTQ